MERREVYRLNRGLISSYLEGKAEDDLLERRAIKLALTLEMLKAACLEMPEPPVSEYILDPDRFEALSGPLTVVLRGALQCAKIEAEEIQSLVEKLKELNRTSFKRILDAIFKSIGFSPTKAETRLFVKCRDRLVHTGRFYDPTPEERSLFYYISPQRDRSESTHDDFVVPQYYFLRCFVDRVILKLLGYNGSFHDTRMHSPGKYQSGFPGMLD